MGNPSPIVFPSEQIVWNHPHFRSFDTGFDFKHSDLHGSDSGARFATSINQKNIHLSGPFPQQQC